MNIQQEVVLWIWLSVIAIIWGIAIGWGFANITREEEKAVFRPPVVTAPTTQAFIGRKLDADKEPVEGWTIELRSADGSELLASSITNSLGIFNLVPAVH